MKGGGTSIHSFSSTSVISITHHSSIPINTKLSQVQVILVACSGLRLKRCTMNTYIGSIMLDSLSSQTQSSVHSPYLNASVITFHQVQRSNRQDNVLQLPSWTEFMLNIWCPLQKMVQKYRTSYSKFSAFVHLHKNTHSCGTLLGKLKSIKYMIIQQVARVDGLQILQFWRVESYQLP